MTSGVALLTINAAICAGVAVGSDCNSNAAAPATCGEAIEVPESKRHALDEAIVADLMLTPGANKSTHDPWLVNFARSSLPPIAPTVIAVGSDAGEYLHAKPLLLPAATANTMPSAVALATAEFNAVEYEPPRLMLATAGDPLV